MSVHIRNLTKQLLHLHRIGRHIEPEATIEVSDEDAAKLAGHPLLDGVPPAPDPTPEIEYAGAEPKPAAKAKPSTDKPAAPAATTTQEGESK